MQLESICLKLLLLEGKGEDLYRLTEGMFKHPFKSIFQRIKAHYIKYGSIPSTEELDFLLRERELLILRSISLASLADNISLSVIIDKLKEDYSRELIFARLDTYLDNVFDMDIQTQLEELQNVVLSTDKLVNNDCTVVTVDDIKLRDEANAKLTKLGLNSEWDAQTGGIAPTELLLLGGKVGQGKSLVCCNILVNQLMQGRPCLYFSIEMRAKEIFDRVLSIMSEVPYQKFRLNQLTEEDIRKIYNCYSVFYNNMPSLDSIDEFERAVKQCDKTISQPIIVDNSSLTCLQVDNLVHKYKTAYPNLEVVVVDYVNQLVQEDMYNWQSQVNAAKQLKNIARKYEVAIVSPYQISDDEVARFSKGLLDAADSAFILEKKESSITFKTKKARSIVSGSYTSALLAECMKINTTTTNKHNNLEFI